VTGGKWVGRSTAGEVAVVHDRASSRGVIGRALADMTGPVVEAFIAAVKGAVVGKTGGGAGGDLWGYPAFWVVSEEEVELAVMGGDEFGLFRVGQNEEVG
jgi:hypothetical protein